MTDADVLIWGEHPAGHVLGLLLASAGVRCISASDPKAAVSEGVDGSGLALLNEQFFRLDARLAGLAGRVGGEPVAGLLYLAEPGRSAAYELETSAGSVGARVVSAEAVRDGCRALAVAAGVARPASGDFALDSVDETGLSVRIGGTKLRIRLLILANAVHFEVAKQLNLDEPHLSRTRRASVMLDPADVETTRTATAHGRMVPIALDLMKQLFTGRLLQAGGLAVASVDVPAEAAGRHDPEAVLQHFLHLLHKQGVLNRLPKAGAGVMMSQFDAAGALQREGVGDRTLCIGPAGGFYSSSGEDLYPGAWSAVFASKTLQKALKSEHPQDELRGFRTAWGASLGEYLQGPQQNLRFLESMVFDNPQMARRLAEAILGGRSVIR